MLIFRGIRPIFFISKTTIVTELLFGTQRIAQSRKDRIFEHGRAIKLPAILIKTLI